MRGTGLRATALKHMILKLVYPMRIIRRPNHDSYMNTFLSALIVFFFSSLKQHSMASPPLLLVPGSRVYLGL